jgi:UDP-hydrolysing UDP-N-acetyl-D-glucosamine 2-epimerase
LNNHTRKICVTLVDRANYGRLKPVMREIQNSSRLTLQVVCAGTMVLERFGQAVRVVRDDGFQVDGEVYLELEGSTPTTMAKSVGFAVIEFASEFQRLRPDFVLLIGDRYEALGAAVAAAYMNIPIVHMQGGEVSGSIDESCRHAISKFSQFHYPATARSRDFLIRMGERPSTILGVGCPSSDLAKHLDRRLEESILNARGAGALIDASRPFLLVLFHPMTTTYGDEHAQMEALLEAVGAFQMQTVLLWPNIDAGSDHVSKAIREFRTRHQVPWLRTLTNLMPEAYLKVLASAACAIGNSSSFVRDASYFGTPVVLVGQRQRFRETDIHVKHVETVKQSIEETIRAQLAHGRYAPSSLYGDGNVARDLVAKLETIEPYVQKHLGFVQDLAAK